MNTREANELKSIIRETIKELLETEEFVDLILQKVNDKVNQLEKKVNKQEEKISQLEHMLENLQQNEKLSNVCIYGIEEHENEKLKENVLQIFNHQMKVAITDKDIEKCYRVGNNKKNIKPVIVNFASKQQRQIILKNSKNLKGTRMAVTEDLIKSRLQLLREAQAKFDRKNVYTYNGNVFIIVNNSKYKINSMADLNRRCT